MMEELTLPATVGNITLLTSFVDAQLEKLNCPLKAQMQIDVALDELFSNIAHYGYGDAVGHVTVCVDYEEPARTVLITLMDEGQPFNPLESADPDVTAPAEEREVGGLGIFLVKKAMDELAYRYEGGQNVLTIRKRIG